MYEPSRRSFPLQETAMRALAARIDEADVRHGDAMTWLARRRQAAGDWPDPG